MLKKYQTLLLILLTYIAVFAFYPSITSDFINLDDTIMVTENPDITSLSLSNIKNLFCSFHYRLYHPIVSLSYAIEYYFCKLDPYLYHVDNIILHILNILLLFFVTKKVSKSFFVSYVVALLFAIHPIHVEVVSWVTSRKDTLYSFFYLLSILFYINIDDSKHYKLLFVSSLITFILSCLSKPMAITLPFILVLIDFYNDKLKISNIKKYITFFIISVVFVYLAIFCHYSLEEKMVTTILTRFIDFMDAHFHYLFYICKCIVPVKLSCLYPQFYNHDCMVPNFIIYSTTMLYLLILFVVLSLKINKKIFFGFFFFLITLLPSSGIMHTGVSPVADRYVYIPCIGLFFIFAELLLYVYNKNQILKYASIVFISIVTIVLFNLTYQRSFLWSDNEKLMTEAINYSPLTADHAYLLRGCIYKNKGLLDLAEKDLQKSYFINKKNAYTVFHLGHLKQKQNDNEKAQYYYSRISESSVNYIAMINNLAIIYDNNNQTDKAIQLMRQILDENKFAIPNYFYHTLAIFYIKNNDLNNALENLKLATAMDLGNYICYIQQMGIYLQQNNFAKFEGIALLGLKNTNENVNILNELCKEYFLRADYESAEKYLLRNIELYPNNHFACFLLGNLLAIKAEYKKALVCYTMAILLSKDKGEYYFKRAATYLMLKKYELAKKDIEKAEQKEFIVDNEFKKDLENIRKESIK